jgi:hypothetical protein
MGTVFLWAILQLAARYTILLTREEGVFHVVRAEDITRFPE